MSGRKIDMCSIFDVNHKCVRKGVECDKRVMYRKRNAAQTNTVCGGHSHSGLSTTQTPVTAARSGHTPAHTYKCALT